MAQELSPNIQDYLKRIYEVTRSGGKATTSQLAEALEISAASVTNMLQKLSKTTPPYVLYKKHQGVALTEAGRMAALKILRRHRLIEQFLVGKLGYSWDEVHEEAESELDGIGSNLDESEKLLTDGDIESALGKVEDVPERLDELRVRADEHALEKFLKDIDSFEKRHEALVSEAEKKQVAQSIQQELEEAKGELEKAREILKNGEPEAALKRIEDPPKKLEELRSKADEHGFKELQERVDRLEDRHRSLLTEAEETIEAQRGGEPSEIPGAPTASLIYEDMEKLEPVGSGGNADVYKAVADTPRGEVILALKEPRMSGTLHTETVERLMKEAETWDKLDDHDHIVSVIDYDSKPLPWIAMEYMDAGDIGDRAGELDFKQAIWTSIVTTKGVRHAHKRGVAHLDLKPENVLFQSVKDEDVWDVPKVADWGLSKHLLDHSKSIEGMSPHYAAPEQFDEKFGKTDDITDIYQLGAVFYEMFTGRPPFEGKPTKVMRAVMDDEPTPPSEVADVPQELDEILLTALAKQKEDRFDDIVYLRDALQELYD